MSKGLQALDYLKREKRRHWIDNDKSSECLDNIEKDLKALEIIKVKKVSVSVLLELDNFTEYNHYCDMVGGCQKLTPEEYNLLKEVEL